MNATHVSNARHRGVNLRQINSRRRRSRRAALWLPSLLALGMAMPAAAASVEGTVLTPAGDPLDKVPVCLKAAGDAARCTKLQSSDRRGRYRFNGLKEGTAYVVSVYQDDTAAGRKFERYRTYVWSPAEQSASPGSRNDTVNLAPFEGKFNFSNFQRGISLSGADFPELASLDLASDYVMLKVFITPSTADDAPETIFLGRVTTLDAVAVTASLPLSTPSISYQIYSASLSIDGFISLAAIQ